MYQFGVVPSFVERALQGTMPIAVAIVPIFTSMFLHASVWHVLANMWALWIFGDNIEDHLGHFRYLMLYLVSGVAAAVLHILFNQGSDVPTVGGKRSHRRSHGSLLSAVPFARVLTVVPFIFMFVWLPAWVVLVMVPGAVLKWSGNIDRTKRRSAGGVAFWAHVGGFIAGITLIKLFPARASGYSFQR